MVDTSIGNLFGKIKNRLISPKKYVSEFVKRQRTINAIPTTRLLWDSRNERGRGLTYIKDKHGKLI